jgi:hypothetical protein
MDAPSGTLTRLAPASRRLREPCPLRGDDAIQPAAAQQPGPRDGSSDVRVPRRDDEPLGSQADGKRYIVCRNETEAEKDKKDREAIVAALQDRLKRGDKALIGNSGYRRYLRKNKEVEGKQVFEIDAGKLADEAQFDGIFVLRTNAKITPLQAVLRYRDLLQVEDLFRRGKALMRTRPVFHSSDAAIRGHVFCTFLALVMQKHLDDLAREAGAVPEWRVLLRDLDRLQQTRIQHNGKDWLVRTDATPAVTALFRQAGVALPPRALQTAPPLALPTAQPAKRGRGRRPPEA